MIYPTEVEEIGELKAEGNEEIILWYGHFYDWFGDNWRLLY